MYHRNPFIIPLIALFLLFPTGFGCGDNGGSTQNDNDLTDQVAEELDRADDPQELEPEPEVEPEPDPNQETWPIEPESWTTNDDRDPSNLHLTWQRDPSTTVTIQWTTENPDLAGYTPLVWVVRADKVRGEGEQMELPYAPAYETEGAGFQYEQTIDVKGNAGEKATDKFYVQWEVEVAGLEPDTLYYYRAGSWADFDADSSEFTEPDLSPIHHFSTGIPKGERRPFSFIAAGDSRGGEEDIKENIDRLIEINASFWVFNGDMTNMGTKNEWNRWFEAIGPLVDSTVLMPVNGNHEMFVNVYFGQFALPEVGAPLAAEYQEHAWSFDYANAHFVGLNSNTVSIVTDQKAWLEQDLAAASQDADIDWMIVMFHHAVYSASNHGSTGYVQTHWLPLFEQYGVDITFAGHDHNYERTVPIADGQEVAPGEGVVHVVAGGFFAPGYGNGSQWWTVTSTHGDKANYVVVEIDGKTFSATAYSGDGAEILDEFTLTKE